VVVIRGSRRLNSEMQGFSNAYGIGSRSKCGEMGSDSLMRRFESRESLGEGRFWNLSCVAFPVTSGPTTGIRPDCLQVPLRMRAISPRAFDEPGLTSPYGTRRAHFESPLVGGAAAAWPLAARAGDRLLMNPIT
jgi:hypothetical protein